MKPKTIVIILNWNGYSDTIECVDSVLKSKGIDCLILIVDNGSENNEADSLKELYKGEDNVKIIKTYKNLGYTGGNNIGFEFARENKFEIAVILNNDTIVKEDSIQLLIGELQQRHLAAVGATIMSYRDKNKIQNQGLIFNPWTSTTFPANYNRKYDVSLRSHANCFSGACFAVKIEQVIGPLFDASYFCYFEEVDLCLKLHKSNLQTGVSTESLVYHKGSVTADSMKGFSEYQMSKNRFLLMKKMANRYQKITFLIFIFLFYWYYHMASLLIAKKPQNIPFFLRGIIDGLLSK